METEIKVLEFLLDRGRGEKAHTIREVAKGIGADYKIVHTAVSRLAGKGLVAKRPLGKSLEIVLVPAAATELLEAEARRRERLARKNRRVGVLWRTLERLPFFCIALVFGSVAKGTDTKHSDIDLMVIRERGQERAVDRALSIFPPGIHLIDFTPEEFLGMVKSREFTVVSEAMKNNVILVGIEDYYRLVQHAR